MTTTRRMTYDDLMALPEDGDRHELVRGAIRLPPAQFARAEAALRDEYIPFVPALIAEVVSRTDRPADVAEKVADYLTGACGWSGCSTRECAR